MKKLFLIIFVLVMLTAKGQVQVTLNVDTYPTPELSEWVDRNDLAIVTVTNTNPEVEDTQFRIKMRMLKNGVQIFETDNTTTVLSLGFGTETYLADEIVPYNSLQFNNNSFRDQVLQTGLLPAGEYSFCIQLLDLEGNVISTPQEVCMPMIITDYQMPELLDPIDGRIIDAQFLSSTLFKWTPLSPQPPVETGIRYLIAIAEVQPGQSASQAFTVNYPIIEEEVLVGTQFNWPLDIDAPDSDQDYVWSIKALTDNDNPYLATNNGFVNIETFTIKAVPGEGNEPDLSNSCECVSGVPVDLSSILPTIVSSENDDQLSIAIQGMDSYIAALNLCRAKEVRSGEFGSKYNNPYHPSNLGGSVFFNWNNTTAFFTSVNNHVYNPEASNPDSAPEQVLITFRLTNSYLGTSCDIEHWVTIPIEIQNQINGVQTCDCTDVNGSRPFITVTQPEPADYPMKLELNDVLQLRDYFWGCNSDWNQAALTMDVDVIWDEDHQETTLNSGPFKHQFTPCDSIPSKIKVKFKVRNRYGDKEIICELEEEVTVSELYTQLNQPCSGTGEIEKGDKIYAGADDDTGKGEFEIVTTKLEEKDGKYIGEGTVYIDWMKANMKVEFNEITVDSTGDLISGEIVAMTYDDAPVYPQDWALNVVATSPWANSTAQSIVNYVEGVSGQSIPYDGLVPLVDPVQVPLGVNFLSGDQLAVVDMVFKYDKSEYNIVATKTTPPSWDNPVQVVGFIAKNIRFHPEDAYEPPIERIELIEDVSIGNMNNKITFTFKAPTGSNSGCYMEWDETGFTEFGVELESSFTRDWLLPVPDDGTSRSMAHMSAVGSDWEDLLFTGLLDKSEIVDSQSMTIVADSISYDMSDVRNPGSITFPDNYVGETSNLFRGFYMKQMAVELPSSWATNTGGQPTVIIEEMIVDDVGVTLYGEATNVISYPNGELADMYASVDTLYIDIEASTFREGGMKGRIGLPISKADSIQNPLKYTALLNRPADPALENYFQLTITPTGPIYTSLLKGEMTLNPTSAINAKKYENGKKIFNINLDGGFAWNDITLGPVKNVDFGMDFQGMKLDYDSTKATEKLTMDIGAWAFASPQKFMANFPVTVDKVEFEQLPTTGNEMLRGKLKIPVIVNLSKKIGGATQLSVEGKIEDKTATGGKKFTPEYVKTRVDSVNIDADMAAVKIKGALGFRNQDPMYGNGFIGTLDAEFKAGKIKVSALAEFGNTTYGGTNRYRYWRVEADAIFPAPGVVFLPGIAFRGFGGGAFKNMKATLDPSDNTYSFKPEESGFGFRANAVLATMPKEETFNMDAGLLGQFSGSGGMTYIGFDGDFYVGAGFDTRDKAKIIGDVAVTYDFPQKHFNLSAKVDVNASPITTPSPANLVLDINGKTNKWYFKFGEPASLNTVKVFGLNLYEYLMFGNDIPEPTGFTNNFRNKYHEKLGFWPGPGSPNPGVNTGNTGTGRGFALGIGFEVEKADSKHLLGNWYATYDIAAGAEVNLAYMEFMGSCGGYNPAGINGWRAKGGAGLYAKALVRGQRIVRGQVKKSFTVIDVKGGAWIWGEFPNPYYVSGAIQGSGKILGISFNFDKSFEKGQKCTNGSAGGGVPIVQGDAAEDMQQNLIQYVNPSMSYNYPTDMPLSVKFGLEPDTPFDVSEQQSNGTVEMRTFKMVKTQSLKIKNESTEAWSKVQLSEDQNNLGEYLYTKFGMTSTAAMASSPSIAAFTPLSGSGSGSSGGSGDALAALPIFNMAMASPVSSGIYGSVNGFSPATPSAAPAMMSPAVISKSGLTPYPAPPGPGGYSNLPSEPDPIVNSLTQDHNYRFVVTATLMEWNGSTWVNAKKNNGQNVTQIITKMFRTGSRVLMQSSGGAPKYRF